MYYFFSPTGLTGLESAKPRPKTIFFSLYLICGLFSPRSGTVTSCSILSPIVLDYLLEYFQITDISRPYKKFASPHPNYMSCSQRLFNFRFSTMSYMVIYHTTRVVRHYVFVSSSLFYRRLSLISCSRTPLT